MHYMQLNLRKRFFVVRKGKYCGQEAKRPQARERGCLFFSFFFFFSFHVSSWYTRSTQIPVYAVAVKMVANVVIYMQTARLWGAILTATVWREQSILSALITSGVTSGSSNIRPLSAVHTKAQSMLSSPGEFRSCVKVEVVLLGSPSPISHMFLWT